MKKYLYGASVQGIQGYIFQTNQLRDIVGASEQVENICTKMFKKFVEEETGTYDEEAVVIHAAGNIKYEFKSKNDCEKIVLRWPQRVVEYAPGITISQAVVEYEEGDDFANVVNELEIKLRAQRNKPMADITVGLMGIHRSRNTNMPAIKIEKSSGEYLDTATFNKINNHNSDTTLSLSKVAFGIKDLDDKRLPLDTEKMTYRNDWIAVIHADGNGLGKIVQRIGKDKYKFKLFSKNLDDATKASAVSAFDSIKNLFADKEIIPIRPIVLGGDDFSVICRADIAMPYVQAYIRSFEKLSLEKTGYQLTACAGIAYIKSSFPFYYGYGLAESLCGYAKKDSKSKNHDIAPSSVAFHKVQDSFFQNYEDIILRELTPQDGISLLYGPYYLREQEDRWTIDEIMACAEKLNNKDWNSVKSSLRQWLTILHDNPEKAEQKKKRILGIVAPDQVAYVNKMTQARKINNTMSYPVYDVLALHTLNTQVTKS